MIKSFNFKIFIISLFIVFGSAFFFFSIVWNILFFLIAISFYLAWTSADTKIKRTNVAFVFSLNLFLNILWSLLSFETQDSYLSFFNLITLWFSIVMMIVVIAKINRLAAYLLIPYLIWVSFVGVSNYISIINALALSHLFFTGAFLLT